MKKLITAAGLVLAMSSVFADSITVQYLNANVLDKEDQKQYSLTYKHDISKGLSADIGSSTTQTDGTNALSARLEAGMTKTYDLGSGFGFYTRGAIGQKLTNTKQDGYYVVEPGINYASGNFKYKVGYRYRSATSQDNNDQTHTARVGVSYALTKADSVGLNFDRMRGDSNQNSVAIAYTRSF